VDKTVKGKECQARYATPISTGIQFFSVKIYDRPKAKEEGPSPKGAARKGRACLTGKRFGIQAVRNFKGHHDNRCDWSSPVPSFWFWLSVSGR